MKIQTEAEEYHEKLAESLLKTWIERGQDRPLQHVGNDQPSDTGGYGSTETGYGGDHSAQDRIKREKTEKDTEKGTASAVPFSSEGDRTCTAGKLAERENPSGNDRAGDTI